MATDESTQSPEKEGESAESALEGGSYEVIRNRLFEQARILRERAEALNSKRKDAFGGTEAVVLGNERVRTENNCVPRDIFDVAGDLFFGYNVFLGLKTETVINDVFSLHKFEEKEDGSFDFPALPIESVPGLICDEKFQKDFAELYKYYKDAKLLQIRHIGSKLLAIFQVGGKLQDIKVFRWALSPDDETTYIDNQGEQDYVFPPSHDFEWKATTRDDHVAGRHPHISIFDEVFVETVGGDLTVKIEDNTEDGMGIYQEDVDDPRQALDDADVEYARVGALILMKILPYQEEVWRYLVYNTRTKEVKRIDEIGQACVQLPEDHGIVFPGGYYLPSGEMKSFDAQTTSLRFKQMIKSPNGEDVLYVFYHEEEGRYLLLPYNMIRKEVQNQIECNGFTIRDDGRMLIMKAISDEPTRVHNLQIWQTPFTSDLHAAQAPTDGSFLAKVGNADLVRGISDSFSICRLIDAEDPTRYTFEDLIRNTNRVVDNYYWLDNEDVGNLKEPLDQIKHNADLIIGEFEKVQALQARAKEALEEAKEEQLNVIRDLRPEDWRDVSKFLLAMTSLRTQRGHLITLREVRYIDMDAVDAMEKEVVDQFDRVSKYCVEFLLTGDAFGPLVEQLDELLEEIESVDKANEIEPLHEKLEKLNEGLNLLSEVVSGLQIEDATQRTQILESISEVFGHMNRVRATLQAHRKELLSKEGKAEFAAQFKLLGQAVSGALAMADSPEKCDDQLSRLMIQLEELEGRFSDFDEYIADLAAKREEIYEAFGNKKQQLVDARQRRAQNIANAADRILQGINRRAKTFKEDDQLNAYFASDAMVLKLRQLVEDLLELEDSVKADDIESRLKSAKRDALRNLRDKQDLFSEGDNVISLGKHRFNVNTQSFELTMVPRNNGMALHLTGTDFYEMIDDAAFNETKDYWDQVLISETKEVYRGEYLAASILFDAEAQKKNLTVKRLNEAARDEKELLELVRGYATERYDEGYERGIHDADGTKILEKLLSVRTTAGLLRFAPNPRALACLFWARRGERYGLPVSTPSIPATPTATTTATTESTASRAARPVIDPNRAVAEAFHRRSMSLGRLREAFAHPAAEEKLANELADAIRTFLDEEEIPYLEADTRIAGRYLMEELVQERPRFTTSQEATRLKTALLDYLQLNTSRAAFEEDLRSLSGKLRERLSLAKAWIESFMDATTESRVKDLRPAILETAVVLLTEAEIDREESAALTQLEVQGLLGNHSRISERKLKLRLDEFLSRLTEFAHVRVPGYLNFREQRTLVLDREKDRLRLEEFQPRVLTSFVRNKLINDVYLPMIGDNLAKQLGAAGEKKRTDLMGMLLLISPPGYGKTTLMEYMASRLGMVFMKVNGPSLGHSVISLDPSEAPNATSKQEVMKINLSFEMANNVMLYLDDIQHTHPELLQKFISLCDGSRRVEGVWKGKTQTYDLRGKKFCIIMAGNPYTESGEKFQIPDMLANRADTYNLGDILDGKDDVFALSYIENALTSNPALAPIAARSLDDMYLFIKMAKGMEVPQTDFSQSYSQVEVEEALNVLKRLFVAQDTLLKVNLQYIQSASMDDNYRTEPPFKLQGSYRNMNKLAEKIVAAMNDQELDALVRDHYVGEAQTLTTGAEQNLLKLSELRDAMSEEERERWAVIKKEFRRVQLSGGKDDDPVSRVTATLGGLGDQLDGIKGQLAEAVMSARAQAEAQAEAQAKAGEEENGEQEEDWIKPHLERLDSAVNALAKPQLNVQLRAETPKELQEAMTKQTASLEQALLPLVRASTQNLEEVRSIGRPLLELIEVLKLNALSGNGGMRVQQPAPRSIPAAKSAAPPPTKQPSAPAPKRPPQQKPATKQPPPQRSQQQPAKRPQQPPQRPPQQPLQRPKGTKPPSGKR